ncbi:MAG: tetratricopeptide repeat protein, partial [bacterium]
MNKRKQRDWARVAAGIAVCGGVLLSESVPALQAAPAATMFTTNLPASSAPAVTNSTSEYDVLVDSPAKKQMYAGMIDVKDKEYEKAVPKLEFAIKEDPTLLGAWGALGWAYWGLGRKDETQRLWERLQRLDPREPLALNLLAQAANARNDLEKAGSLLKASLELNHDQYEVRIWQAQNLLWRGRSDQALPLLRQLLVESPDRMDVRIELARALTELTEYEDAMDHWAIINDAIPDNPDY